MRRAVSIGVAAVLAVAVIFTVVAASGGGGDDSQLEVVRAVIGSEKQPFFDDPAVKAEFAKNGLRVDVDTAGSRQIATSVDLAKYDFAFPAGTPAAERIRRDRNLTSTYVPFFTPMAVATFEPIAQLLRTAGVATDHGGWWSLDIKAFLALVAKNTRWTDLPGNTAYPATKSILITSTDPQTSNSAAMYASMAAYVANGDNVVATPEAVLGVAEALNPLFSRQGYTETSSEAPFEDFLSIGIGKTPMVMIYEAQFVARAAARDGSIRPGMLLMYPDPGIQSKHTVVPLTEKGDRAGQLLLNDPTLQRLAVTYGFRTSDPAAFASLVSEAGVGVAPNFLNLIDPPAYETLEALLTQIGRAISGPVPPAANPSTSPSIAP